MKLRIQNLGPVKDATIDLGKKLTVFCGPNGTGKTWAAYVVYGVVSGNRISLDLDFDYPAAQTLFSTGRADLDISPEQLFDFRNQQLESLPKHLASIFPVAAEQQEGLFGRFSLRAGETKEEYTRSFIEAAIDVTVESFGMVLKVHKDTASQILQIVKESGDTRIIAESGFNTFPIIAEIISAVSLFPNSSVTVLPVERSSIYTFTKELSLQKRALFDRMKDGGDVATTRKELSEYFNSQSRRYPEAIRDSLRTADDLANIRNRVSSFYEFAEDVEAELLHGQVGIGSDGEVTFASEKARNKRMSFQLSSSAVKTISSLIIYLKYQAQPNDLIIIDEPELNLHPDNQILLARLFARMINQGLRLLISTHSDYIVRELNNLIMLAEPEPALKKVAEQFGYRDDEKISRDDIGVYLFHFKEPGDKHATVEPVPVDQNGFEVKTVEDTINRLNAVSEEIYYTMKYGEQVRDEQA